MDLIFRNEVERKNFIEEHAWLCGVTFEEAENRLFRTANSEIEEIGMPFQRISHENQNDKVKK